MTHMTVEEVAKVVKCDLRLMNQSGQSTGIDAVKRLIAEIKLCWLEMEPMKDKAIELFKLIGSPEDNPQLRDGARLWYE